MDDCRQLAWEAKLDETIQRIMVPGVLEPGSHFCHVTRAGPHIWVSGIFGMNADGSVPPDTVAQFDLAVEIMDQCLNAASAGPKDVVKVQIFLTNILDRSLINPRRAGYFGDHRPASTLVEVSALVDPRLTVEIECQAFSNAANVT